LAKIFRGDSNFWDDSPSPKIKPGKIPDYKETRKIRRPGADIICGRPPEAVQP